MDIPNSWLNAETSRRKNKNVTVLMRGSLKSVSFGMMEEEKEQGMV